MLVFESVLLGLEASSSSLLFGFTVDAGFFFGFVGIRWKFFESALLGLNTSFLASFVGV